LTDELIIASICGFMLLNISWLRDSVVNSRIEASLGGASLANAAHARNKVDVTIAYRMVFMKISLFSLTQD
jgi:hypothetical protein